MTTKIDDALMFITPRPDLVMERGEGSWLWDERGRRYLDFVQGWGVNALGHVPKAVRDALLEQSARLLTPSPAFHNRPQLELARALAGASGLGRVFFANSGAEANEGAIKLARTYLQALRDLTRERGTLLILDEVQTGMGRTGELFAFEHAGIRPDILTLGKGLGAGVPLAALLSEPSVACFEPGEQGGTYNGNPLMTHVGLAVLQALQAPGFLAAVAAKGALLRERLVALGKRYGCPGVRGQGLLNALCLPEPLGARTVERCREQGFLVNSPAPDLLRFMPALTVTTDEIEEMVGVLGSVWGELLGAPTASSSSR